MLTIKPEENYKPIAEEMGIELPADAFVMVMKDGNLLMGIGAMHMHEDYAVIDEIAIKKEYKDFTLEYGMGKALLNAVDLKGIKYVVSDALHLEKQLRALRFKSPDELKIEAEIPDFICGCKLCLSLDGYFSSNC